MVATGTCPDGRPGSSRAAARGDLLYSRPASFPAVAGYPVSVPLIGREPEKALFERMLEGLAKGRGGMLLLTGPVGSGKTRLLEHIASRAEAMGAFVAQGNAAEGDSRPYMPFHRALEEASRRGRARPKDEGAVGDSLPLAAAAVAGEGGLRLRDYGRSVASRVGISKDWGPAAMRDLLPSSEEEEVRLEELPPTGAVVRLLERIEELAPKAPVVITLDCFQWADPASLSLLRPLAREARRRALLVVVSYDAGEALPEPRPGGEGPTLDELARSVQRESGTIRVQLRGLSDLEVRKLAEEILGGPLDLEPSAPLPEVLGRTGGNPFFLQEVVRAGLRDGWIARRGDAFRVLEPAQDLQVPTLLRWWVHRKTQSLLPGDRTVLEAISVLGSEFDPRALPALVPDMASRLKPAMERLEARHGLLRQVRPSVWQVVPGFLASVVRSELSGEVLRRLHRRAGEWQSAHDPHAVEKIAMHYYEAAEPTLALPWLERAWKAAADRGDNDATVRFARQAQEMARTAQQPDTLLFWQRREATGIFQNGDVERAAKMLVDAMEGTSPGLGRVEVLCELALLDTHRGNPTRAMAILNRADAEPVPPEQKANASLRVRVYRVQLHARLQRWDEITKEAPLLIQDLERGEHDLEPRQELRVRVSYGTALSAQGEFPKAREVLLDALSRARRSGLETTESNARTSLGILALSMGDLGMARAIFEQSAEEWRRRGGVTNQAINTSNYAEVLLDMGELEEGGKWLEEANRLCELAGLSQIMAMNTPLQARLELARGNLGRAEELLQAIVPAGRLAAQEDAGREGHATLARILLAKGDLDAAWREAEKGGQQLSGLGGGLAARTYAVVQAARGETFRAEALLNKIVHETQRVGRRYEQALALEDLGEVLQKQGRVSEARGRWNESLGLLRACGALSHAARLEARRNALAPSH